LARRVEGIGETLADLPLQIAAQYYLLLACFNAGDYRGTEDHCRRLIQLLTGERFRERFGLAVFPAVISRAVLARVLAERGMFDEGDSDGQQAIRLAEALDHPFGLIWACLSLAYLNSVRGELSAAERLLERALVQGRDWSITLYDPIVMACLGQVQALSGRVEQGLSLLQQGVMVHDSRGIGLLRSMSVVQLGEAYLLANQVEAARACADRAVRMARERGEHAYEAWALRLLGEIASHSDRLDVTTADAHFGAATALASERNMRPLIAHCRFGLGKLYGRTGNRVKAQEHLTTAAEMYRRMEMRFWPEKAEAARAAVP